MIPVILYCFHRDESTVQKVIFEYYKSENDVRYTVTDKISVD